MREMEASSDVLSKEMKMKKVASEWNDLTEDGKQ
jgi:hypothetical protein